MPYLCSIQIGCPCRGCCITVNVHTLFVIPMCFRSSVSICDDGLKDGLELHWPDQWWSEHRWWVTYPIPFHPPMFFHLHRPSRLMRCNVSHCGIECGSLKIASIPTLRPVIQEILEEFFCFSLIPHCPLFVCWQGHDCSYLSTQDCHGYGSC